MSGFSVNDAMAKLGIYKAEADALDALDGKKDGKIANDIFTQAEQALQNAEAMYSEDNEDGNIDLSKWSDVAKSMARTITQKMGLKGFIYSSNKSENLGEQIEDDTYDPVHEQMDEMAAEAADYIAEHKSLKGFKFTGVPNGVTNIKINYDGYYGAGENDVVTFDEEGKAVVEKVIDGVSIEIHYTYKGSDYALGGAVENDEDDNGSATAEAPNNSNGTTADDTPPKLDQSSNNAVGHDAPPPKKGDAADPPVKEDLPKTADEAAPPRHSDSENTPSLKTKDGVEVVLNEEEARKK